jgi:outer membrane protein
MHRLIPVTIVVQAALVLFCGGVSQAQTEQLTLGDLIQIALVNNPTIEIAQEQYSASEGVVTQARSRYLPHLGAGADYSRKGIDPRTDVTEEDNVGYGLLKASQLIYDFGRTTGLIDSTKFSRSASAENLKQAYHDVVFQVKSSFYSVLQSKRLITVAEQAVENYEQQLYRAQKFYEAGVRTRIDVTNAEVNLSNQKLNLLRANSDLKTSIVELERVLGTVPYGGNYELVTREPTLEELAESKPEMPGPLDALVSAAMEYRPGLKQFDFLVQAADSAITQAQGDYYPSIDAFGDYNSFNTDLPSFPNQWQVGVGLNWEFFSGFETEGKVAEARAQFREVKASLREFELSVTQDVTDSYLRADENREGVDIADQTLELSKENLKLADGRYKAGIGDVLEFNDAQLLFTENQSSLVVTYYNYLTALARIERAIGVIPELQGTNLDPKPEQSQ